MIQFPFEPLAVPCVAPIDGIYPPSPCPDLNFKDISRIIIGQLANVQNSGTPVFATTADFADAAKWTTFLSQAPINDNTVLVSPLIFEATAVGDNVESVTNGYANNEVKGNNVANEIAIKFLNQSQEFKRAIQYITEYHFNDATVFFITRNNEVIYLNDSTAVPKMIMPLSFRGANVGGQNPNALNAADIMMKIPYGHSANFEMVQVATSVINFATLGA